MSAGPKQLHGGEFHAHNTRKKHPMKVQLERFNTQNAKNATIWITQTIRFELDTAQNNIMGHDVMLGSSMDGHNKQVSAQ